MQAWLQVSTYLHYDIIYDCFNNRYSTIYYVWKLSHFSNQHRQQKYPTSQYPNKPIKLEPTNKQQQKFEIIKKITPKMQILLTILSLASLLPSTFCQSLTISNYSVNPNYAKSSSSLYSFSFNAGTSFTANFDIRVYYPTQYTITAVSGCGVWVNGAAVSTAVCSVSLTTNEVVFTQLQLNNSISNLRVQFRTSTARYSGSSNLIFYYYNITTGTIISSLTNYVSLTIVNAVMSCSINSTSAIVGDNVTYTLSYTPLVPIETNTVLQMQMQPWGPYSQSNFITSNVTLICNGACTLSVPANNGNISQIVRFTSLYSSQTSASGSVQLSRARNPPSTKQITINIVMLAKISTFSQQQYMNCSSTFSVSTPNTFRSTNFAITNSTIGATNIATLRLQLTNPISSISYVRIQPAILTVTYQFSNYNMGTQPFQTTTSDSSLLLGNFTLSTTSSPSIINLNNFTLINPPYANKPVTLTFTTQNLVDSTFYLIDRGTFDIVASPSTIIETGVTVTNTSINAITRYTLWFKNINRLISTSFIYINFPSQVTLTPSTSTCSLSGLSSTCVINNSSMLTVDINTVIAAGTNMSIVVNAVTNPSTTTPTSTFTIYTYYEDSLSLVDQLLTGLTVTATSVPLMSVQISSSSPVVGQVSTYTLNVQISNMLPMGSIMRVKIPTSSFATSNVVLVSFTIGSTVITGCTLTTLSAMYIQLESSCFPTDTPAATMLKAQFSNITNPASTKPTNTWTVQTLYNSLQMQYLMTGITITMNTPAQITIFSITPGSQIVNEINTYKFDLTFIFPHSSGDRVILSFPDGLFLSSGFQCLALTTGVSVSCYQSSPTILQINFVINSGTIGQLSFNVTQVNNNWFSSTRTMSMQTTTNDSTYYYVQSGQSTVNFISTSLTASALSNQMIILLGQSTVKLNISSPFTLTRATTPSDLYLTVTIPGDLTPINSSCSLSYTSATCILTGQSLNITGFGDFSTAMIITFRATTSYFVNTSTFISQLYYAGSLIGTNSVMKLSSYCTTPCKQCTSTPTQCITCLPTPYTVNITYFPDNSTCVAVCPVTYFVSSASCANCNTTACYGCTGTANTCTSCQPNRYLYLSTCLSACPTQFYPSNGSCIQCVAPCLTCTSATVCLTCTNNYFLDIDSRCVLTCSNISYIGLNGTCQLCTNNCKTCSRTLSNCTSCENSQYLLFNNTCVRACSSGYYNNINSTCEACVSPCLTCSSRTICQTCIANYYLFNGNTCTSSCPNGTIGVVNRCQACDVKCATCSITTTNCLTCAASLLYYLNQCVQTCPPLTYPFNKTCTTCITPCVTCASSPQLCTTCITGMFLLNNTCLTVCPNNGYYTSGTTCLPCTENCLTCQSLASCSLCQTGFYLLSGGCVSSCPDSHPIVSNRQCLGCSEECATCSGTNTNCTTCTVYYFKYTYTCVKQCPITFYSNTMTYECEEGLSKKIVFFPILITAIVVIALLLAIKCFTKETSFITATTAFLSPLQLSIWCYVLSLMFLPIKQPDITYTIPIVLIAFGIFSYILLGVIFFFVNKRKMDSDDLALQWANNNVNYAICQIIRLVSLLFGCKFFRLVYSRLFNSITLSLAYRNRSNVFTVATIFTLCFLIFCQIPALVGCWSLVYSKRLKDQTFYTSIEGLILTIIAVVFSLIDIYKADDYFEESEFCKMKKYVEKVKDFSSMNRIEEGFEVSHEEGSVDAERFVSTSGGKFFYSKQKPEDIKDDFYFQQNQGASQATDAIQIKSAKKKWSKAINIFAPIAEQQAEHYENEKYSQEEIKTEAQLQKMKRKLKSIGSDEEEQLVDKIERREELGPTQDFDDSKSLLNERQMKTKWNNILGKRMELSEKIFNRHPPNLAQIDEPMFQDQNANENQNYNEFEDSSAKIIRQLNYDEQKINENYEEGTDSQINTKKKKRKRKVKMNKELQQIYLQRLTDKKKSSSKDVFTSDKSFKYDF